MKAPAAAASLALAGCMAFNSIEVPIRPRLDNYQEKVLAEDPSPQGKVAMIDLDGILLNISEDSVFFTRESTVVSFVEKLKLAEADPKVKALVVRIDSPGGDITTSDVLYHELLAFKERKKIPVVAVLMGVAASGGYYVASACDRIVAHPTTITGSIGVVAMHVSLAGLLDKIGVKATSLKGGALKDAGSIFRDLTEDERKYLQKIIDLYHDRFIETVAGGRKGKLAVNEVRALADGRVFTASQALEAKLVDGIGYIQDGAHEAQALAGLKSAELVMYSRRPKTVDNPYAGGASWNPTWAGTDLDRVSRLVGLRLFYLWEPYLMGR